MRETWIIAVCVALAFPIRCLAETAGSAKRTIALPTDREMQDALAKPLDTATAEMPDAAAFSAGLKQLTDRYQTIDFDPDLKAKTMGNNIEDAFRFMRDRIRLEIYPGALRGAKGCYMSRAGDTADRALLLSSLLKANGVQTRFATGHLSRETAEALIAHMFDAAGGDEPGLSLQSAGAPLTRRIVARAQRDYALVSNAMAEVGPVGGGVDRVTLINEVTPHVWVQAKVGENWKDLDPSLPDSVVGKTYCPIERTAEGLPDEFHQKFTIRVVAEFLEGGQLKRSVALEVRRPTAELLDKQIFLFHSAEGGLHGLGKSVGGKSGDGWIPVLWLAGEPVSGAPINFGDQTAVAANGGGIGAAIDAFSGLSNEAPKAAGPVFVAETLEFEAAFPGGRIETTRQVLCDRGGAAWRAKMPLSASTLKALARDETGPLAVQSIRNIWISGGRHDLAAYAQAMQVLGS